MADFNFGQVGAAVEAGRHADANISMGPVDPAVSFTFLDHDFSNFVANQDRIFTVTGSATDFVWGQKWGNLKTRVAR